MLYIISEVLCNVLDTYDKDKDIDKMYHSIERLAEDINNGGSLLFN